jgi:hypothetical protein
MWGDITLPSPCEIPVLFPISLILVFGVRAVLAMSTADISWWRTDSPGRCVSLVRGYVIFVKSNLLVLGKGRLVHSSLKVNELMEKQ